MGKYATYPDLADSKVEWLGRIPSEWQALPIAALLEERGELNKGLRTENVLSVLRDIGVIPYEEKGDIGNKRSDDIERYKVVHPGDLVVNSMNVIIGSVGVSAYHGALSPVYLVLKPRHGKTIHKHYVGYAFQIKTFQQWLKRLGYGILEHRLRIPMDNLKREYLPVPPYADQERIVGFLDHETAKIDRLIAKQERLIELLKEKRQAVISHVVTKGLNPDVPMKDSGVEWLGEVPVHWDVVRVKFVAKLESGHTPSKQVEEYWVDCNIPWVSLNDSKQLAQVDYISDTAYQINDKGLAGSSARLLPPGAVVFTRDATIGLTAITAREMAVSQHLIAWLPGNRITSLFLLRVFNAMKEELDRFTFGATIKTIGMDDVKSLTTTVPPLGEQEAICQYIDERLSKFNLLIDKAESQISLLREHRISLISSAVTGKIDVRGWQMPNNEPQEAATAVSA